MTPLDQLTRDLSWRESELASLKILLGRKDISPGQREVLLRAAWAMLYAHYEGFVKAALTIFYDEAKKRVANCGRLPLETRASALMSSLKKLRSMPATELIAEIENFDSKYYTSRPEFDEIDTKSNLWPSLLIDLLSIANIGDGVVRKRELKLKTLVNRRNGIAHGKRDVISDLNYYIGYESAIYDLMYELAFLIDARLNAPPYV